MMPRFGDHRQPYVHPSLCWTTLDEISYLQDLRRRGKLDLLKNAQRLLPERVWYGPGMKVDPIRVSEALREMIEELEPQPKQ